jgi:AcrR family transcriptional regulator
MNDRKRQVLLTAQQLFLDKGFAATSIQDILDESCISKGTFYNYFSSKNECLMAMLEHARDESTVRRQELLIGRDISDKDVLAEQIWVRMLVNHEQNLIPIFEAVFHSSDEDLRAFVKKMHLAELTWLAGRFVDAYGKKVEPYASDCAVLFIGAMQHMMHVWSVISKEELNRLELVKFTMRRIDSIVSDMMASNDTFLPAGAFFTSAEKEVSQTKEQLLEQLRSFHQALKDDMQPRRNQYVQFLSDEIHSEHPRVFLLEPVVRSFREAFAGTQHESAARDVASNVWNYVNGLEKLDK